MDSGKPPPALPDFLGRGWAFPVTVQGGRVALTEGDANIAESVRLILETPLGQRIMLPEFGCRINQLLFAPLNEATLGLAESYVKEALERWEPRIRIIEVRATADGSRGGKLLIRVDYVVRDSDVPQNLVYPFFLQTHADS